MAQMVEERLKELEGQETDRFAEGVESGSLMVGSPERVRKVIRNYADAGVDQLILMVQAGRIPHEKIMQTIRLLGEEVLPAFR